MRSPDRLIHTRVDVEQSILFYVMCRPTRGVGPTCHFTFCVGALANLGGQL